MANVENVKSKYGFVEVIKTFISSLCQNMILNGEDVNRDAGKGENVKCEENKSLTYGGLVSKQSPVRASDLLMLR